MSPSLQKRQAGPRTFSRGPAFFRGDRAQAGSTVSPVQDTSIETAGPKETEAAGAALAARLHDGDLVLVRGELGAGKTTFVRGAARALGVSDPVTSPTFSIGHRYAGDRVAVSHIDLYRVGGLDDEEPELLDP